MLNFKFSGHETFPCRYPWLSKACAAVDADSKIFAAEAEEDAMVKLGVGRNMVRAMKFWAQAVGVVEQNREGGLKVSSLGEAIFLHEGLDQYLEDVRTLWLIHWKLATHSTEPLFAWDFMLNRWQHPEITRSEVIKAFQKEAEKLDRKLSTVTLEQHFDTFLHTYIPTRGRKGEILEDNLDCPLIELDLIQKVGERKFDKTGKRETVYSFRRGSKHEITPELFVYCLQDFWSRNYPNEKTLTFRHISVERNSPGQIFKLSENDLRERLEAVEADSGGVFSYQDSVSFQQLEKRDATHFDFLSAIYQAELVS